MTYREEKKLLKQFNRQCKNAVKEIAIYTEEARCVYDARTPLFMFFFKTQLTSLTDNVDKWRIFYTLDNKEYKIQRVSNCGWGAETVYCCKDFDDLERNLVLSICRFHIKDLEQTNSRLKSSCAIKIDELRSVSGDNLHLIELLHKEENKYSFTKILSNKKATIVWFHDEKVVVKRAKGDKGDVYNAVAYAIAKHLFETNAQFKRFVDSKLKVED